MQETSLLSSLKSQLNDKAQKDLKTIQMTINTFGGLNSFGHSIFILIRFFRYQNCNDNSQFPLR